MKTYVWGYNNMITFEINSKSEDESYIELQKRLEIIEYGYKCVLPCAKLFDLINIFY